jgi:hypothetical protein
LATLTSTVAFTARAILTIRTGIRAGALSTAPRSTASAALASDRGLLVAHATVENAEGLIEPAVDLRGALAGRHSTAATATTAALRTVRSATSRAARAAGITTRRATLAAAGRSTHGSGRTAALCAAACRATACRTTGRAHRAGCATGSTG